MPWKDQTRNSGGGDPFLLRSKQRAESSNYLGGGEWRVEEKFREWGEFWSHKKSSWGTDQKQDGDPYT